MSKLGDMPADTTDFHATQEAVLSGGRSALFTVSQSVDYAWEFHVVGYINCAGEGDRAMRLQVNDDTLASAYRGLIHRHFINQDGTRSHDVVNADSEGGGGAGLWVCGATWSTNSTVTASGMLGGVSSAGRVFESRYASRPDIAGDARCLRGETVARWGGASTITSVRFQMTGMAASFTGRITLRAVWGT